MYLRLNFKLSFFAGFLCLFASMGWANSAPTDINASNLTIAENSAIGTVIGEFNATDPDGDTNITFSLVPPLPSDLNISLWLDASDASTITQSNGSVSQWADKSGNENHAIQETDSKKPTFADSDALLNYKPSIKSNSQNGKVGLSIQSTSLQEIFIVAYYKDGIDSNFDSYNTLISGSGSNGAYRVMGKINSASWYGADVFNNDGSFQNGSVESSTNALPMPATLLRLKSSVLRVDSTGVLFNPDWNDRGWVGGIGEILGLPAITTTDQRETIEAYLAHKWGLESNFPSDHPARNLAFSLDQNGTLAVNQTFDFETDDLNYTITVRAFDDHNASFVKNFTITVTNVVESTQKKKPIASTVKPPKAP